MTWNLKPSSLPQLKQLNARIAKEIAKQEAAVKTATLKKLARMACEHGLGFK